MQGTTNSGQSQPGQISWLPYIGVLSSVVGMAMAVNVYYRCRDDQDEYTAIRARALNYLSPDVANYLSPELANIFAKNDDNEKLTISEQKRYSYWENSSIHREYKANSKNLFLGDMPVIGESSDTIENMAKKSICDLKRSQKLKFVLKSLEKIANDKTLSASEFSDLYNLKMTPLTTKKIYEIYKKEMLSFCNTFFDKKITCADSDAADAFKIIEIQGVTLYGENGYKIYKILDEMVWYQQTVKKLFLDEYCILDEHKINPLVARVIFELSRSRFKKEENIYFHNDIKYYYGEMSPLSYNAIFNVNSMALGVIHRLKKCFKRLNQVFNSLEKISNGNQLEPEEVLWILNEKMTPNTAKKVYELLKQEMVSYSNTFLDKNITYPDYEAANAFIFKHSPKKCQKIYDVLEEMTTTQKLSVDGYYILNKYKLKPLVAKKMYELLKALSQKTLQPQDKPSKSDREKKVMGKVPVDASEAEIQNVKDRFDPEKVLLIHQQANPASVIQPAIEGKFEKFLFEIARKYVNETEKQEILNLIEKKQLDEAAEKLIEIVNIKMIDQVDIDIVLFVVAMSGLNIKNVELAEKLIEIHLAKSLEIPEILCSEICSEEDFEKVINALIYSGELEQAVVEIHKFCKKECTSKDLHILKAIIIIGAFYPNTDLMESIQQKVLTLLETTSPNEAIPEFSELFILREEDEPLENSSKVVFSELFTLRKED